MTQTKGNQDGHNKFGSSGSSLCLFGFLIEGRKLGLKPASHGAVRIKEIIEIEETVEIREIRLANISRSQGDKDHSDHSFYIRNTRDYQGWTDMYTLVVPSLSTKFIKNSHKKLPV